MLKISDTKGVMTNTSESKVMEDITCTVYSSFEDIVHMQKEWDSFVESVDGGIYLTFDWCRLRASLFASLSRLLHLCYYRIWFSRLAPRLPFKRRPLWKLWIRTRL